MRIDDRRRKPYKHYIVMAILLISLLPFVSIVGMSIVPLTPIEIHSVKILNPGNIVKAGDHIIYAVDATKYTDRPARILRQLVNDRVTHYTPIESNIPTGKKRRTSTLITSKGDPPGEYYIKYTLVYRYFGFRDVAVSTESDRFMIVK